MSCDYLRDLDVLSGSRYRQKLSVISSDCPYTLPANLWKNNPREWPFIEYPDVYHYLVKTPGVYTGEEMGSYKSLRSKNLMASGWVQIVYHHKVDATGITIFKADVIPSYRTCDKPHKPWVAVAEDGTIVTAHCDCKAGLGESCTHVGGLLYKLEMTCRMGITQAATCTDKPCAWNNLEWAGVQPARLAEMDFYSSDAKNTVKERAHMARTPKRPDVPPNDDEKNGFLVSLLATDQLGVGLSLFRSTARNFVSQKPEMRVKKVPRPMRDLVRHDLQPLHPDDLAMVEETTRSQAASITWHEQRTGRITSSNVHKVMRTNPDFPAKSTLLQICTMNPKEINVPQLKWGREHEKVAIKIYADTMGNIHNNFRCTPSGLHIHPTSTMLAASPDGLVSCDCCGTGTVEVKCPYTLRELAPEKWPGNAAYPLDENQQLQTSHPHYAQVQHHMYVTERSYCDYVLWSTKGCLITRVVSSQAYADTTIPKLCHFWTCHIKPELLTGSLQQEKFQADDDDRENQVYCTCGRVDSNKPMIGCDNESCPNKWFHWDCVGLLDAPKKKTWYCPVCRSAQPTKRRRIKKAKK